VVQSPLLFTGKADKFGSKNDKRKFIEAARQMILSLDSDIEYRYNELISSHSVPIRRYRFLVDYMLDNIFYPLFSRDLHKRTKI
jgi:hypothetical protein